jgi:hypothetical protein
LRIKTKVGFVGSVSKPRSAVCQWFGLKTDGDGFLRFDLKTGDDGFSWFGLKIGALGFMVWAFIVWASKPVAVVL